MFRGSERPELDFAQGRWGIVPARECSSGEACRVEQAFGERSRHFYHVPAADRSAGKSVRPELAAHGAERVAEGEV